MELAAAQSAGADRLISAFLGPAAVLTACVPEVRTEKGKLYLFVAVDQTSKYAFARLMQKANTAKAFLDELVEVASYRIHTALTDNGIQFADLPKNRNGPTASWRGHPFNRACAEHGVEHRLTKPNHPCTNGQVERMNRTLKEATARRYHDETHRQLEDHLAAFLDRYNFARRLKALRGLTPYEAICTAWANEPDRFRRDPLHLTSGLNTQPRASLTTAAFEAPSTKALGAGRERITQPDALASWVIRPNSPPTRPLKNRRGRG